MPRVIGLAATALVLAFGALGCGRPEPLDPHEYVAAETARVLHASPGTIASSAHVSCRCDADAGLHVVAPAGSVVTVPPDAVRSDAEADIVVVSDPDERSEAPGTRLRHTVSLGFVGDGKLTDIHSQGYDDGGFFYPPAPSYDFGGGASYRTFHGAGIRHGFSSGTHRGFSSGTHGGFHGGSVHGGHGSHGGGGGHGGHGGHGGR